MNLLEREDFLSNLRTKFNHVQEGEGHCILLSGEAGLGKTSLVRAFCREHKNDCTVYQGTCDALFTPRILAPLHDIALQMQSDLLKSTDKLTDTAALFSRFLFEIGNLRKPVVIVLEDIHWADEATLDFIKFLARRITRVQCLFILTYRNDEIHQQHPLRNVLGQLNAGSLTRLALLPLSREAVNELAIQKGYSGQDVYSISGGNPFYVNEILASYSPGVPDNIKDSILSVYNRQDEKTRQIWAILSILPTGCELHYLERMEPEYGSMIESSLDTQILLVKENRIFFKHELYRRTIEASLSPIVRVELNKAILDLFLANFDQNQETERIIHHAKNANRYELVVQYAVIAAKQASAAGAHIEAAKLYYSAIEYYQGQDKNVLVGFYENYAYESHLISMINEAVIYQTRALAIWKEKGDSEKTASCLRFLSRLWWLNGDNKKTRDFAQKAIKTLDDRPDTAVKAMVFSNLSQLEMVAYNHDESIFWGEKALSIANQIDDYQIISHALTNIGSTLMLNELSFDEGVEKLQQSLDIALRNSFHEHTARAYTYLGTNAIAIKKYEFARKAINDGISYCEARNLNGWYAYLLAQLSKLNMETGHWDDAYKVVSEIIKTEYYAPVIKMCALPVYAKIKMRRGDVDVRPLLLEAKARAFDARELQRILPALSATLEYEWITGESLTDQEEIDQCVEMIANKGNMFENGEFAFWLSKAKNQQIHLKQRFEGYQISSTKNPGALAKIWEQLGCPYEHAIALTMGSIADKKTGISMLRTLGAEAVCQKLTGEMRNSGVRGIPRGKRQSTKSNPAHLTTREVDILQLLQKGLKNKEIAEQLFIAPKTVDHHTSSILLKLNVNSRGKAIQEAARLNIIK